MHGIWTILGKRDMLGLEQAHFFYIVSALAELPIEEIGMCVAQYSARGSRSWLAAVDMGDNPWALDCDSKGNPYTMCVLPLLARGLAVFRLSVAAGMSCRCSRSHSSELMM